MDELVLAFWFCVVLWKSSLVLCRVVKEELSNAEGPASPQGVLAAGAGFVQLSADLVHNQGKAW